MDAVTISVTLIGVLIGLLGGLLIGLRMGRDPVTRALTARGEDQAVIRNGLDRLHERMQDLEHNRVAWQSQLRQHVEDVRLSTDSLRRETTALSTALRRPHVRGQWGEMHLRRSVELAGMVDHCDFTEQLHVSGADGNLRPDLVVHLAGAKSIVVDSKVPLDAYLDALAADSEDADEQQAHLRRHSRQLRAHIDALSGKAYWRALPSSPEFVVLFVPAESFLSAALETDPSLIEYAAARDVVLATPTTLIALLRTIAHGWTTETMIERTREIHELGRDLYSRLGTMGGHLDRVGRSLKAAVEAYNKAIGSLESRVLVTARQFEEIGAVRDRVDPPTAVVETPRPLTAAELLEVLDDPEVIDPIAGHGTTDRPRAVGQ
jgi:DNA recombination protein RmuC